DVDPPRGPKVLAPWRSQTKFATITDGLSNTFFVGEKHVVPGTFGRNSMLPPLQEGDGSTYNGDYPWVISRAAGVSSPLAQKPDEPFRAQFGSWHPGTCPFVMGDGSVRHIPVTINGRTLSLLAQRADGEQGPE